MSAELLAAFQAAESEEDFLGAFQAGLDAAYRSHPREGADAALEFLNRRAAEHQAERDRIAAAAAKLAEEAAKVLAAEKAEADRLTAEALNKADA